MQLIVQYCNRDEHGEDTTWSPRFTLDKVPSTFTFGSAADMLVEGDDQVMPQHMRVKITGDDVEITPLAGVSLLIFRATGLRNEHTQIQEPMRMRVAPPEQSLRWWQLRLGNTIVQFRWTPPVVGKPPVVVTTSSNGQPRPPDHPPFNFPIGNPPLPMKPPPPPPVRIAEWSVDPVEQTLLATLRDAPANSATRTVYADWLAEHDLADRAAFVRGSTMVVKEPIAWRAVVSRAAFPPCERTECPKTWDALTPTREDDLVRTCPSCRRRIRYDDFDPDEGEYPVF